MKKNYSTNSILLFSKALPLCLILVFSLFTAQTGPNDDFDGDTITNSIDLDDDNDGILDSLESPTDPINTVTNPTFAGNITGWTTSSAWSYYNGNLAGREDLVPTATSVSQSNVSLKNSCTSYAIYQLKLKTDNYTLSTGAVTTQSMELGAYLEGVRLFGVSNPINSNSPTITRDAAANSIITDFWVDGALISPSTPKNISISNYHNVQIAFNPALLPATGKIEFKYTSTGDDILIDDVYFYINSCLDTDNDGLPNQFDLDSDGDGCPDAIEGGGAFIASNLQSILTVNHTYSGGNSGANYTGSSSTPVFSNLGSSSNAQGIPLAGPQQGIGSSQDKTLNTCIDSDGDGIPDDVDIDDDNDGILDVVEDNCQTINVAKSNITVTKPSTINYTFDGTQTLANLVDGTDSNDYIIWNPTGTLSNSEWFRVQFSTPKILTEWEIGQYTGQRLFSTATTYKVQGSNDGNSWTDLTGNLTYSNNQSGQSTQAYSNIAQFPQNNTAYTYYRYYGVSASVGNGWATEFYFKEKICSPDFDGDGIPNRLDLDSDNDDCSDLTESGVSPATDISTPASATNSNGQSYGIAPAKLSGSQLNTTAADTNNDGLNDSVDPDLNGVPNYSSTYKEFALTKNISTCADSDGDGIKDLLDIDDDNDGILDKVECPNAFTNLVKDGGFTTNSPPNWYMSVAPYNPPGSAVYTYGGTNANSQLTGGLFSELGGDNSNTGLHNILVEAAQAAVYRFDEPFISGVSYKYSFDLGNRASGSTYDYTVQIYNADTDVVEVTLQQGDMNTLPSYSSVSGYKNFSGTFTVSQNANYYLLFSAEASGGGTAERDFIVDRVAIVGSLANPNICDTDNDGIPNHLDTDSDNDGCSDAKEAGVIDYIIANGGTYSPGTLDNPTNSSSSEVTVGNNTPANYGANGFYTAIESNDTQSAAYKGTYTYSNAINSAITACTLFCYRPAVTAGTVLDTQKGITSLGRAGVSNSNWPMVRKGGWIALEAKTKGFVPNRLSTAEINAIPAANLVEGMMVYNITLDCLQINTDGTAAGWKCFNTQACP